MNATRYFLIIGVLLIAAVARAQISAGDLKTGANPASSQDQANFNATSTNALGSPSSESILNRDTWLEGSQTSPASAPSGAQSGLPSGSPGDMQSGSESPVGSSGGLSR